MVKKQLVSVCWFSVFYLCLCFYTTDIETKNLTIIFIKIRTLFLFCENDYIVAASYSGNAKTPDWFYNLSSSNPFITINNERFEATYELIESSDKEYYWSLLDQVYPTFQMYRKRTDRDIPLIKFSKVEAL